MTWPIVAANSLPAHPTQADRGKELRGHRHRPGRSTCRRRSSVPVISRMASWKSITPTFASFIAAVHHVGPLRHPRELIGDGLVQALGGLLQGNVELLGELGGLAGELTRSCRRSAGRWSGPRRSAAGTRWTPSTASCKASRIWLMARTINWVITTRESVPQVTTNLLVLSSASAVASAASFIRRLDLAAGVNGRRADAGQGVVEPLGLVLHAGREPEAGRRRRRSRRGRHRCAEPIFDMASAIRLAAVAISFIFAMAGVRLAVSRRPTRRRRSASARPEARSASSKR